MCDFFFLFFKDVFLHIWTLSPYIDMVLLDSIALDTNVSNILTVLLHGGTPDLLQRLVDSLGAGAPASCSGGSLLSSGLVPVAFTKVMPATAELLRLLLARARSRVLAEEAAAQARVAELREELATTRAALALAESRVSGVSEEAPAAPAAPAAPEPEPHKPEE